MTDTTNADGTEFSNAWDVAEAQGQPDQGRAAADDDLGADETGGPKPDADRDDPPAGTGQTADADPKDLPAGGEEISDELAGLPEPVRQRLTAAEARAKELEERATKAENTLRSNEGRYSRALRENHELRSRQAAPPKDEKPAAKPEPISDEVLDKLEGEYEDLKPLVAATRQMRSELAELKEAGASRAEIDAKQAEIENQEFVGRQYQTLDSRHSDWRDVAASRPYAEWALSQPGWLQELIAKNGSNLVDGEAAAFVFDRFKADTAPKTETQPNPQQERRDLQREGSLHIPARSPAMEPRAQGGGDFDSAWDAADDADRRRKARR